MVLTLAGPEPGELAPSELEMLSRSLMGTLSRLARERDLGTQVRLRHYRGIMDPVMQGRNGGLGAQL